MYDPYNQLEDNEIPLPDIEDDMAGLAIEARGEDDDVRLMEDGNK